MLNTLKTKQLRKEEAMKAIRYFLQDKTVVFNDIECNVVASRYNSGHIFMQLIDKSNGHPYLRLTLDVSYMPLIPNLVVIKSYNENKFVYEALLKAGIITPCDRLLEIGLAHAHVCFLNIPEDPTLGKLGTVQLN